MRTLVDLENNIWFVVFNSDTTSNILVYKDGSWKYEFPDDTKYVDLRIDSKGTIWAINNHYEKNDFIYSTLKYYKNSEWFTFNTSDIDSKILTVNSDDKKVYIGKVYGLIEKIK